MIRISTFIRKTEGATAVIIAICLFSLLGVASLAIDMGHLYTVRNEMQNVADAAALAGVAQLIQADASGNAARYSGQATTAAKQVAQSQRRVDGLTAVADGARNDLTLNFGTWNIYAGNPTTAWTPIALANVDTSTTANALQVTITRDSGTVFGPVSNIFAKVFNANTSVVSASATAYLGFTSSVGTGTVTVPLAIPQTVITAMMPQPGSWFAQLLAPRQAFATTKTLTFKDLGSGSFNDGTKYHQPKYDIAQAYLFVVNQNDSVPGTINDNLTKYTTTGGTPVRPMKYGDRLYPLSEFQWGSNIKTIFTNFKSAYTAMKNSTTNKWRCVVPTITKTQPSASLPLSQRLAKALLPGASEAQACFTFWTQSYTGGNVPIWVNGFATIDITAVTVNASCVETNPPDGNSVPQVTNTNSCRNTCSLTAEVVTDHGTVLPAARTDVSGSGASGGKDFHGTSTSVAGLTASIPCLVK
jgi:Flp pilus assembly protein TadG